MTEEKSGSGVDQEGSTARTEANASKVIWETLPMSAFEKLGRKIDEKIHDAKAAISPNYRIIYSRDRTLFYISSARRDQRSRHWMSVERHEGSPPQDKIDTANRNSIFGKPMVEFTLKSGERYWREQLPFAFWKVSSGDEAPISPDEEIWKDYAAGESWPK